MCDDGVPSVCDLVDYGSPILPAAEASIATMCEVMGRACSNSGGMETGAGQCGDDDGGDDDGSDSGVDKGTLCWTVGGSYSMRLLVSRALLSLSPNTFLFTKKKQTLEAFFNSKALLQALFTSPTQKINTW